MELVFFGFRIMVGIGFLLFFTALYGVYLLWRKKLYKARWLQRWCVIISPLGFVATLAGWITAESGRQPWIIYHAMRVSDAASNIPAPHVLISLLLFMVIYSIIFAFYLYYLFKFIRKGPLTSEKVIFPNYMHPEEK